MEARLSPCIPLPLPQEKLNDIVDKAKDWALMHGVCMRSKTNFSTDSLDFAPFALLPSVFPRKEFDKAVLLQTTINELMHKVAHDHDFLEETLKNTIQVDEFTGRLFKLYETVRKEGFAQHVSLGIFRSDYLCQYLQANNIKQVEVNTISSSFGTLATRVVALHRYVLQELGYLEMTENIPENTALQGICYGMVEAWEVFGQKNAVILFVIEDVVINICDQRFLEFEIRKLKPDARVIRRTLIEIGDSAKLGPDKELIIDGMTIAVVYYRTGYTPDQYVSEKDWDARLLIERSTAIKCPSIHYHLAGTKKVQQALAVPGCLERFFNDVERIEAVRSIFTGLYSLDNDVGEENEVKKAIEHPENYVLKPQREGGGHNIYGDDIKSALLSMSGSKEGYAWILMDRIHPPVQANYVVRPKYPVTTTQDIVGELGIFGVVIGDEKTIKTNKQVGYMVRSKPNSCDEGGVAAGFGVLDSLYLI